MNTKAGTSPGAAASLEDLIDACVMESTFRSPMAELDLLFHDAVSGISPTYCHILSPKT
jgi:hypothetical protein